MRNKFKVYSLIFVVVSLVCLQLVSHVSAETVTVASYTGEWLSDYAGMNTVHPSTSVYSSAVGESFQASESAYLIEISTFWASSQGVPSGGTIECWLFTDNVGTYGVDMRPSGSPTEVSSTVYDVEDTNGDLWLDFTFSQETLLTSGSNYTFMLVALGGSGINATNYPRLHQGYTVYGGNFFYYVNSAYSFQSGKHLLFYVYGDTDPLPTPSPSASADSRQPVFFEDFVRWLVPMALILGFGLLLWKFAGKWGFFTGMICGLVVSYLLLGGAQVMWAYIIIGIVLLSAMFASTRGNS